MNILRFFIILKLPIKFSLFNFSFVSKLFHLCYVFYLASAEFFVKGRDMGIWQTYSYLHLHIIAHKYTFSLTCYMYTMDLITCSAITDFFFNLRSGDYLCSLTKKKLQCFAITGFRLPSHFVLFVWISYFLLALVSNIL